MPTTSASRISPQGLLSKVKGAVVGQMNVMRMNDYAESFEIESCELVDGVVTLRGRVKLGPGCVVIKGAQSESTTIK